MKEYPKIIFFNFIIFPSPKRAIKKLVIHCSTLLGFVDITILLFSTTRLAIATGVFCYTLSLFTFFFFIIISNSLTLLLSSQHSQFSFYLLSIHFCPFILLVEGNCKIIYICIFCGGGGGGVDRDIFKFSFYSILYNLSF